MTFEWSSLSLPDWELAFRLAALPVSQEAALKVPELGLEQGVFTHLFFTGCLVHCAVSLTITD